MPLPMMADEPSQMLGSPGMESAGAPQGQEPGQSPVQPEDQARGAVQQVGQMRKQVTEQLKAVATQFPTVAKECQELQQLLDQGIQKIVKSIVRTTQTPEAPAPAIAR